MKNLIRAGLVLALFVALVALVFLIDFVHVLQRMS